MPLYYGPGTLSAKLQEDSSAKLARPVMDSAKQFSFTGWLYPKAYGPGYINVFSRTINLHSDLEGLPSLWITPDGFVSTSLLILCILLNTSSGASEPSDTKGQRYMGI